MHSGILRIAGPHALWHDSCPMYKPQKDNLPQTLALLSQLADELRAEAKPAERVLMLKRFRMLLKVADAEIARELPLENPLGL